MMTISLPVGWTVDAWPTDLTQPALCIEEFVIRLRRSGADLGALDQQLIAVGTFSYYCGSVAGGGHVDFICNNEADFLDLTVRAEHGARILGLDAIAAVLIDFRKLLPSGDIKEVYKDWAANDAKTDAIAALDGRLFDVKLDDSDRNKLSETLTGAARDGFEAAVAQSKYEASNPQYVCAYAWLGGYAHVDHGTFRDSNDKIVRIVEMLTVD